MVAALERAAADAGSTRVLAEADRIAVPKGLWDYSDPARLVAGRVGAARARTCLAEIGILQQTLVNDACRDIASGSADVVLIVGGEARWRHARARTLGVPAPETLQAGVAPDVLQRPDGTLWAPLEAERGLVMPVNAYALLENALGHAEGRTSDAHRDRVAELWAGFSRIAADNPRAWHRRPLAAAEIRDAGAHNRMLAFPYTKRHTSQWNVDQAAALVLCSVGKARALGLSSDGWVFPLAGTESNHMVPVAMRAELHRCPAAAIAGGRAFALAGVGIDDIAYVDLYSCFPVAVEIQARELGLGADRPLTVTGGMAFAGGPLNNYVLQSTVRMAEVLRADAGSVGLVTAVSGMVTKQGVALWSTTPPRGGFGFADVTAEARAQTATRPLVAKHDGPATVASYTVVYADEAPAFGVTVCDLPDGSRTVATTDDPALAAALVGDGTCGRTVRLRSGGMVSLP